MENKKIYILDMFPYPSGEGLHAGHVRIYSCSDFYARFKKMNGYDVLHPTGFDAFGLPAEKYAIKNKINPKISTAKNIENFKRQMKMLSLSYNLNDAVSTTDPEFYKWTQWIFKQLYKKGLAFESNESINWCPSCKTGLANEDLEGNNCEVCGTLAEKKLLRQWNLKITDYAEKLLAGLDNLDWKENFKDLQRNWIGKSEGSEIDFKIKIQSPPQPSPKGEGEIQNTNLKFTVFTTRADTLFGCTYCVLAPEHDLVKELLEKNIITNKNEVEKYIEEVNLKTDIERGAEGKEKTGVRLDGVMAINPANQKEVPVFIADYVLASYGTGAIMAVPAHDARDNEFARKYNIEILELEVEDTEEARKKITEKVGGKIVTKYKLRDWVFARQRYWGEPFPIVFDENHKPYLVADSELPVLLPEVENYEPTGTGESPLAIIDSFKNVYGYINDENEFISIKNAGTDNKFIPETGKSLENPEYRKSIVAILFDEKDNKYLTINWKENGGNLFVGGGIDDGEDIVEAAKREIVEETGYVDFEFIKKTPWTIKHNYFAHSKNVARRIDCDGLLFKLKSDKKQDQNLEANEKGKFTVEWVTRDFAKQNIKDELHKLCFNVLVENIEIKKFTRETNTMPQWAGSSWYYLRFMDPYNNERFVSAEREKYWEKVDVYVGGAEHVTRHLIYARFWHKVLFDLGLVSASEPFQRLECTGLILGSDGTKMSKRLGNIVSPDDVVNKYSADVARLYVGFIAPFHENTPWNDASIIGLSRFIERVKKLNEKIKNNILNNIENKSCENKNIIHQTIKKVGEDIEAFKFNTAISQMMICLNEFEKSGCSKEEFEDFIKILSPFAPNLYKEIFDKDQKEALWPSYDENKILSDEVEISLQINGKFRESFKVMLNTEDEEIKSLVKNTISYKKYILETESGSKEAEIKKIIIVKNKLINIVF